MMRQETQRKPVSWYREFAPVAALQEDVLCLWEQEIAEAKCEYPHRVLPDTCVDIVLINDQGPMVAGPWTECFVAHLAPGARIVGARFQPGRASAMLGIPASELLNQCVPLEHIWRRAESERYWRIAKKKSLVERRSALEAALCARLAGAAEADRGVTAAMRRLAHLTGSRVEEVSGWMGISSRQLQRRFCAAVGYGPKMFQSVLRFQRLLNLGSGRRARGSLAEISVAAGYADQAHMNREVLRFSGMPPTALLPEAGCALQMSNLVRANGSRESGC